MARCRSEAGLAAKARQQKRANAAPRGFANAPGGEVGRGGAGRGLERRGARRKSPRRASRQKRSMTHRSLPRPDQLSRRAKRPIWRAPSDPVQRARLWELSRWVMGGGHGTGLFGPGKCGASDHKLQRLWKLCPDRAQPQGLCQPVAGECACSRQLSRPHSLPRVSRRHAPRLRIAQGMPLSAELHHGGHSN